MAQFNEDGLEIKYFTEEEVKAFGAYTEVPKDPNLFIKQRLEKEGNWTEYQMAGRRYPIGCVSLEITQRCNLDCTLCYLSDNAEAVRDLPLQEVYRRIDYIHDHYGPYTGVQVSGGDPTLRNIDELVLIVKRIKEKNMEASLFTNGIKASREMLEKLVAVGLVDVAFHVDVTQERKGYDTEVSLNEIRKKYIDRCRGLDLSVFFNTTVCADNFKEIPQLVEFFKDNADGVNLASFQLQADTGRGVLRERSFLINIDTVIEQIHMGSKAPINFDFPKIGHSDCNRYSASAVVNGNMYDMFDDAPFLAKLLTQTKDAHFSRNSFSKKVKETFSFLWAARGLWTQTFMWGMRKFWKMKTDLIKSGFKVNKISFYIHNFMDESKLECDRINSCVFMVATVDGPMSMCMHNAKRDQLLLKPVDMGETVWEPLTGLEREKTAYEKLVAKEVDPKSHHFRHLKGRVRKEAKEERAKEKIERKKAAEKAAS